MVTVNMIAEYLSDCNVAFLPECGVRRFGYVVIAAEDAGSADVPSPAPSGAGDDPVLCCLPPQAARERLRNDDGSWALVVYQGEDAFEAPVHLMERTIFCRTSRSYASVAADLQRLFLAMGRWVDSLRTALLQGSSYQGLLDCSEAVLGNFVSLSDSEFRLMAYTRSIPIDDPVSQEVVRLGYHPASTIELFRRHNALRDWEVQTRVEVKPAVMTRYPTLDYVFRSFGSYFVHVVMQCNNRPPTPALRDAFQLLVDHVDHVVRQSRSERFAQDTEATRLFGDLIDHRFISRDDLARRLGALGLAEAGPYQMAVLSFPGGADEKSLAGYYAQRAKESLPSCVIGTRDAQVLVVDPTVGLEGPQLPQLQAFVNAQDCAAGLSEPFESLTDLPSAYQQARQALSLSTGPRPSLARSFDPEPPLPLYRFRDCLAAYVVEVAKTNNRLIGASADHGITAQLAAFDREHGTEDLRLLYVFLRNERNVRLTCEELFMHRSTLLYRIGRMQERLGFDLDDAATRQRILMEYLIRTA